MPHYIALSAEKKRADIQMLQAVQFYLPRALVFRRWLDLSEQQKSVFELWYNYYTFVPTTQANSAFDAR